LRELVLQAIRVNHGYRNACVLFKTVTHFGKAVITFVTINPNGQLAFFDIRICTK
jgi:hypothetical protein